jgi:hypothetical protein
MTRLAKRDPIGNVVSTFRMGLPRKPVVGVQPLAALPATLTDPIIALKHCAPPVRVLDPSHFRLSDGSTVAAVPVWVPRTPKQWTGDSAKRVSDSVGALFSKFTVGEFSAVFQGGGGERTRVQRCSQRLTFLRAVPVRRVGHLVQAHRATATIGTTFSVSGIGEKLFSACVTSLCIHPMLTQFETTGVGFEARKRNARRRAILSSAGSPDDQCSTRLAPATVCTPFGPPRRCYKELSTPLAKFRTASGSTCRHSAIIAQSDHGRYMEPTRYKKLGAEKFNKLAAAGRKRKS